MMKVPMSSPDLTEAERAAVAAVLQTPNLSMGPQIEAFEAAVATLAGRRFGIAVSSGTAALHLCVRAAGIKEDDLVITSPFSFVASANVMLYERAIPIFVDVDPETANLDAGQVRAAVEAIRGGSDRDRWIPRLGVGASSDVSAILAVDIFGQPADYAALTEVAKEHELVMIEDASEALGAEYQGQPVGSFGDIGALAFYPNKQLTTGEGGMVVVDREDWAERTKALRNQGRAPGDAWLQHTFPGYNYRLDEMSAALGNAQAQRFTDLLSSRAKVAGWYGEALSGTPGIEIHRVAENTTRMSWFVYVVRLSEGLDRRSVMEGLLERGIPSRAYFEPIHLQPYMVDLFGYQPQDFPIAEDLGRRSLALPFSGVMTQDQVGLVSDALSEALS